MGSKVALERRNAANKPFGKKEKVRIAPVSPRFNQLVGQNIAPWASSLRGRKKKGLKRGG